MSTEEQGIGGDRAGTRWAEGPLGAGAGREGCSRRILPHHSFLTTPGIHLHLLLHKHHRSCVGMAWGTRRGLALGPCCPAPCGWDVMEGGRDEPRADSSRCTHTAAFLFQPGLPQHDRTWTLHSQTCGGSDKLGLACEVLHGFRLILFSFCYVTLLQFSSTAEHGDQSNVFWLLAKHIWLQ